MTERARENRQKNPRRQGSNVLFIGDVHGKILEYQKIIQGVDRSVQVGDFGIGFMSEYLIKSVNQENGHKFIRGNHDDPNKCKTLESYISDGTYWADDDMLFVGGGLSIDKAYRIEGVSWWPEEELTQKDFQRIIDLYRVVRPKIMVSHDCPEVVLGSIFTRGKSRYPSITRQAFQTMWEIYKPRYWIFGHYHISFRRKIRGTQFIGLNELESFELNMGE